MSFVAVAIGGAAVVGGIASNVAANRAGAAAERGAQTAADAQVISTQMQIDEIARQFDYQQDILLPQIQQQYNAQGAFADLLGLGGPTPGATYRTQQLEDRIQRSRDILLDESSPPGHRATAQRRLDEAQRELRTGVPADALGEQRGSYSDPRFPGQGATQFQRGPSGEFIDPNLDPTRLADVNTYGDTVRANLQAGTDAGADPYRNYIDENRIAAATAGEDAQVARARDVTLAGERGGTSLLDERGNVLNAPGTLAEDVIRQDVAGRSLAEGAAGTGVYGETFEESPGYAFAVEESNRATDRLRSRGGNYGGRAIVEAQRRAVGLANQEYYNYAAGRERDLGRLGAAEAQDAARLDQSAYSYQDRVSRDIARGDQFAATDIARGDQFAAADISRGDRALAGYEQQRIADVGRGDEAYQDYLRRREGDAARLDSAAQQEDQLIASDRARSDQAYYNYLRNVGQVAGFGGGPAATAVDASAAAGAQTAGAYRSQGNNLSNIYSNLGATNAQIEGQRVAGISNALVGGAQNFLTYRAQQPAGAP